MAGTSPTTGYKRKREGVGKDAPIKMKIKSKRQLSSQMKRAKRRTSPMSEKNTYHSTHQSQQNAFREQLPDQTCACCAQRCSDGHFAFADGGAYEQNIGDIHARQQQHQRRQAQEETGYNQNSVVGIGIRPRAQLRISFHA
jgi:hypothetical protein